jgi:hypothetical protein
MGAIRKPSPDDCFKWLGQQPENGYHGRPWQTETPQRDVPACRPWPTHLNIPVPGQNRLPPCFARTQVEDSHAGENSLDKAKICARFTQF